MANFKTRTGRRPDLERINVNRPEGYIGTRLYPVVNVVEKAGKIYYKTLTTDAAAQTGRSPGVAPTRTLLTDSNVDYTVTEKIKRYGIVKSEVKQMGGIAKADRLGGMASKRSVLRAQEDAHAAAFFDATSYSNALVASTGEILQRITEAAQTIKRYGGKMAFVCPVSVYQYMIRQTEIKDLLLRSFSGIPAADVLSLSPKTFRGFLQGIFQFDEVLIGDDDHWEIVTQEDAAGVVRLPDPSEMSHKMDPVLGKTVVYLPDGKQAYEVESHYDEDDKTNNYDATGWDQVKELNSGAKKLIKGLGTPTT